MDTVTEMPFNKLLNLQAAAGDAHLLRLPSGGQYLNHLGTVHASALLALAEASSGEFLLRSLGGTDGIVPVVRRLEVFWFSVNWKKQAGGLRSGRVGFVV